MQNEKPTFRSVLCENGSLNQSMRNSSSHESADISTDAIMSITSFSENKPDAMRNFFNIAILFLTLSLISISG